MSTFPINNMQSLGTRLQTILRSVPRNSAVADIGTDHAFLPIALIKSGIAQRVIACDVNSSPLAQAAANIRKSGAENIELRLSDGLNNIDKDEVDVITVAGMGGDLICEIIRKAVWLKSPDKRLILQPMTSADAVRKYLYTNGFEIINETAVEENGRVYSVITAQYNSKPRECTPKEQFIGSFKYADNAERRYIDLQYGRVKSCAESLKNVPKKREDYLFFAEAERQIRDIIEEGLKGE